MDIVLGHIVWALLTAPYTLTALACRPGSAPVRVVFLFGGAIVLLNAAAVLGALDGDNTFYFTAMLLALQGLVGLGGLADAAAVDRR